MILASGAALGVFLFATLGFDPTVRANDPPAGGVLIDYTPLRPTNDNRDLTLEVKFSNGEVFDYSPRGPISAPEDMAFAACNSMKRAGIKAELVGKEKTTIRVVGWEKDGKVHPATEAEVRSKTIPAKELPKVTNPPKT